MTEKDKLVLLHFITRTTMYIFVEDESNMISFIHGYEAGNNNNRDFTSALSKHMEDHLSIKYRADGWNGQIKRYAYKKGIPWTMAFKHLGLEVLASEENGGLDQEMQALIQLHITSLLDRISEKGDPWFDPSWIIRWKSVCLIKSEWFKKMWSDTEFKSLKRISQEINQRSAFEDWKPFRPTATLLKLKASFYNT